MSALLPPSPFDKNKIDVVFYHGYCSDGFGSAMVVRKYFTEIFGKESVEKIRFKASFHSKKTETIPDRFYENLAGKNVLFVDFTQKKDVTIRIMSVCNSLMILDHHKSAQEDLADIDSSCKIFDMKRSGVGITWNYFFGDAPLPLFLSYIQDRDLWTNSYADIDAFVAFFYDLPFEFEVWEPYFDDAKIPEGIEIGKRRLEYKNLLIEKSLKQNSYRAIHEINGKYHVVGYVNSNDFRSELGNGLVMDKLNDFGCVWSFDGVKNQSRFSLRSVDTKADVGQIAALVGGGGHRNASGININGCVAYIPFPRVPRDEDIIALLTDTTGLRTKEITGMSVKMLMIDCKNRGDMYWKKPDEKLVELLKHKHDVHLVIFCKTIKDNGTDYVPKYNFYVNQRLFDNCEISFTDHFFKSTNVYPTEEDVKYPDDFITELSKSIVIDEA